MAFNASDEHFGDRQACSAKVECWQCKKTFYTKHRQANVLKELICDECINLKMQPNDIPNILCFPDDDAFFLDNFYEGAPFYVNKTLWKTTEHYFQAMKTFDKKWQHKILAAKSPGSAKYFGQRCPMRPDWNTRCVYAMAEALYAKFTQNPDLAARLCVDLRYHYLEEGNGHGDNIWGCCPKESFVGTNYLGFLLMGLRTLLLTDTGDL